MPKFLAIYTMKPESLVAFRDLPKTEQKRIDDLGLPQWKEWEDRNAGAIVDGGGMVGKNLRVSRAGTAPATNDICGYVVVEAETIEAAAAIFDNHPHFATFPGDTVDIMPFVTEPPAN
jgi:hypothetical protein